MHKNAIFFFSGTGNSYDIAKRLAEKMGNTELYNIATIKSYPVDAEYKRVGIVFPVYGFTMPNIVKDFIKTIRFSKNCYYFSVATLGAFALGAMYRTSEAFNNAGARLHYATTVYMPENYILFSKVPTDKLINKHLLNSVKRIEDITHDVMSRRLKPTKKPITYGIVQKISEFEANKWRYTARKFKISDSCNKCRKCIRLCPVDNVLMSDGGIAFGDKCQCCLLCVHVCPQKAIDYGDKTKGKKRYINPNIIIEDMKKH